jgi:hypothetical protein
MVDCHRFKMTAGLKSSDAPRRTSTIFESFIVQEFAGAFAIKTGKTQARKHVTAIVCRFPDFVHEFHHAEHNKA